MAVAAHLRKLPTKRWSLIQTASEILEKRDIPVVLTWDSLERSEFSSRRAVALLKEAQEEDMLSRWWSKNIHGPYRKTIEMKGKSRKETSVHLSH